MKLIKQHATNALEQGIALRLTQEHPFGDKSNTRARTDHALESRLESDIFTKDYAHLFGHPSGGHACRQPTRLQHHNLPLDEPRTRQNLRNLRGLTASRGSRQHHGARTAHAFSDLGRGAQYR